jgi:hypothetical protein
MTGRFKSQKPGDSLYVFRALFCGFVLAFELSACKVSPAVSQRPRVAVSKTPNVQVVNQPLENKTLFPSPVPLAPNPASPVKPADVSQLPPAASVAEKLKSTFSVNMPDARSLDVRRANRSPEFKPSLFEQSIILTKVRSFLNAAIIGYPRMSADATLRNAIARIVFRGDVAPDAAAQAISGILSIGGVDQVSATFPDPAVRQAAK